MLLFSDIWNLASKEKEKALDDNKWNNSKLQNP